MVLSNYVSFYRQNYCPLVYLCISDSVRPLFIQTLHAALARNVVVPAMARTMTLPLHAAILLLLLLYPSIQPALAQVDETPAPEGLAAPVDPEEGLNNEGGFAPAPAPGASPGLNCSEIEGVIGGMQGVDLFTELVKYSGLESFVIPGGLFYEVVGDLSVFAPEVSQCEVVPFSKQLQDRVPATRHVISTSIACRAPVFKN